ncbi:hypothetical protein COCON_G00216730 [Conger conger]|uniref:Uncharacterized protein n=1 Tax=Conger conger TaxID=82655 RepID=A0A9Q1CXX1_CONCO|nr:hypothetical protein COCON_G00216730 [Conger conger]
MATGDIWPDFYWGEGQSLTSPSNRAHTTALVGQFHLQEANDEGSCKPATTPFHSTPSKEVRSRTAGTGGDVSGGTPNWKAGGSGAAFSPAVAGDEREGEQPSLSSASFDSAAHLARDHSGPLSPVRAWHRSPRPPRVAPETPQTPAFPRTSRRRAASPPSASAVPRTPPGADSGRPAGLSAFQGFNSSPLRSPRSVPPLPPSSASSGLGCL